MNFEETLKSIYSKSPFQKKKLEFILLTSQNFFNEADKFIFDYSRYLKSQNISFDYAIDSYIRMCNDMVKSQIYFMKHGKYPIENQTQAFDDVYNSRTEMYSFMVALALSQYLWKTHYEMFKHFQLL